MTHLWRLLTWSKITFILFCGLLNVNVAHGQEISEFQNFELNVDPYYSEYSKKQLECLARNVYYESGREPFKGQMAVAQVTVNRAYSGKFPSTICEVVSQYQQRGIGRVCQFSWYCDRSKNKNFIVSETHPSFIAARRVLIDGARIPDLGSNTFYFHNLTVRISESYPYRIIARIGNHIFYAREK